MGLKQDRVCHYDPSPLAGQFANLRDRLFVERIARIDSCIERSGIRQHGIHHFFMPVK
jgi:hypothetical protein